MGCISASCPVHAGIGLSAYWLAGPLGQHWYFFIYLHLKSTTCLQYCLHSELITETCSVFVQFFRIVLFGFFCLVCFSDQILSINFINWSLWSKLAISQSVKKNMLLAVSAETFCTHTKETFFCQEVVYFLLFDEYLLTEGPTKNKSVGAKTCMQPVLPSLCSA